MISALRLRASPRAMKRSFSVAAEGFFLRHDVVPADPDHAFRAWTRWNDHRNTLDRGGIVVLDGGTGTEAQRLGAEPNQSGWSCAQSLEHPDVVRRVHALYLDAGCDFLTANTYAAGRHVLDPAGLAGRTSEINHLAVSQARDAIDAHMELRDSGGDGDCPRPRPRPLLAGSISCHPPQHEIGAKQSRGIWPKNRRYIQQCFNEQASLMVEAGADAIQLEMIFEQDLGTMAWQAAVATGLPVFVALSLVRSDKPKFANEAFIMATERKTIRVQQAVAPFFAHPRVAGIFIHHTPVHNILPGLRAVREAGWRGPLGAYPDQGYFRMPEWIFEDMPVSQFVDEAAGWAKPAAAAELMAAGDVDARMLGGCCGIGPEYIRALSAWRDGRSHTGAALAP